MSLGYYSFHYSRAASDQRNLVYNIHVWQSQVKTLFGCVFRSHYCVRSAVVQNFVKEGGLICAV